MTRSARSTTADPGPPVRRRGGSALSPPSWVRPPTTSASTAAPRCASRAPRKAHRPRCPRCRRAARSATPYTPPSNCAQVAVSPDAARCMSVPSGSRAIRARSAARTVSTSWACLMSPRVTFGHHHRTGDAGVVAQGHRSRTMPCAGRRRGDGPADVESRLPALFPPYLDIRPCRPAGAPSALARLPFRRVAGGLRSQRHPGLGSGEQAFAQLGRPGERRTETLDVDHVHAYAYDHGLITEPTLAAPACLPWRPWRLRRPARRRPRPDSARGSVARSRRRRRPGGGRRSPDEHAVLGVAEPQDEPAAVTRLHEPSRVQARIRQGDRRIDVPGADRRPAGSDPDPAAAPPGSPVVVHPIRPAGEHQKAHPSITTLAAPRAVRTRRASERWLDLPGDEVCCGTR